MTEIIKKFNTARNNLLLVVIVTAINVVLHLTGSDISFLFSAFTPIYLLGFWFTTYNITGFNASSFEIESVDIMGIVIAVAIIAVFLGCYFLSKKYKVFILVALILFVLDTLVLAGFIYEYYIAVGTEFDFSLIMDIAFHVWILYYLVSGVNAWAKMRSIPLEEIIEAEAIMNIKDEEVEETIEAEEVITEVDKEEVNEVIDAEIIMDDANHEKED